MAGKRLTGSDPQLVLEMSVCAEYRIPHSELLSWDQDDRDKAIWWHMLERERCPGCGTRHAEWDESEGGHRNAYIAEPVRCRGCEVRQQAEASVKDEDGRGIHIQMRRRKAV